LNKYTEKIVLVTGSRRGVGRQIVQHFIDGGATVIGFSRGEGSITHERHHHIKVDLSEFSGGTRLHRCCFDWKNG